jgi:hypothetical protein
MVKVLGIGLGVVALLGLTVPLVMAYLDRFSNPGVIEELRREPDGERARKVMVLTLPSGRLIPVNYLREGARVYAGADGRWWRELAGDPKPVELLVRGERLEGLARAVRDDSDYTKDVFARLRPKAVPGFGTLIEIRLDPDDPTGPVAGSP